MRKQELINKLVGENLVKGIGVSLKKADNDFIERIQQFPNAVIHIINGIATKEQILALSNHNLKILILGYKRLRRGIDYDINNGILINNNQKWLYSNIQQILYGFKIISFDNLALEQLNIRRLLSEDEWERYYMGDDGEFTFYIDMVEQKFAKSSTASFDKRYDLLDNVDDMFKVIKRTEGGEFDGTINTNHRSFR